MARLSVAADLQEVSLSLAGHFGRVFDCEMLLGEPLLAAPLK